MTLDFYIAYNSPPCRLVWMVMKHCNIQFNAKEMSKDTLKSPEYIKLNPQGRIPLLIDDGLKLCESRAIAMYLINNYGGEAGEKIYPKDPLQRAKVDEMLWWDGTQLCASALGWVRPQLFTGAPPDPEKGVAVTKALNEMEYMLSDGRKFLALGDQISLADMSAVIYANFLWLKDFDMSPFPKVNEWTERVRKELPYFEETFKPTQQWKERLAAAKK